MAKHVLIVGAGIIGSALAFRFAREGAGVTVVDAGIAARATPLSFFWINASWGQAPHYHRFRIRALDAWDRLLELLEGEQYDTAGTLYFSFFDADLEDMAREQNAAGNTMRMVDRREIAALEPAWREPPEVGVLAPRECSIDAGRVAARLLMAARDAGADIISDTHVTNLQTTGGRVNGVRIGETRLNADEVILTAGAGSEKLLEGLELTLALTTPPGVLVNTAALPVRLKHIVLDARLHVQSRPDGRLLAGEEFSGEASQANAKATSDECMACIRRAIAGADEARLDSATVGYRPTPGDGLPAFGRMAGVPGLSVAVMHSGVTLAPLVSEIMIALLLHDIVDEEAQAFRADRFAARA